MPVTVYIAATLDGYIADADGGVSFLDDFAGSDHGYDAFWSSVDALLMGRSTYDFVAGVGPWPYADKPCRVMTARPLHDRPTDAVEAFDGAVGEAVRDLEPAHIWAVGGGSIIAQLLGADLIDRIRLFVVPRLLGSGTRLFASGANSPPRALALTDVTRHPTDLVELIYARPANA